MQRQPLVRKVEQFLHERKLPATGMMVAVSGGPDSVALLRALIELQPNTVGPLTVAHLNHRLRGKESDDDEIFVRDLARARGLEFKSERIDVAAVARAEAENLEKAARQTRYDWLARIANEAKAGTVATGHTADDQAETVLHRLLRGSGLKGLRGILARRSLTAEIEVLRPMLQVTRAEVLDYLQELHQDYRQDPSNLDLRFTRNRIRHELLPLLEEKYNPGIVSILRRLAEQAEKSYWRTETKVRKLLNEVEKPRAGAVLVLDKNRLARVSRPLIREMFRLIWMREDWPQADMNQASWNRLAAVVLGEMPAADLPGGLRARCRENVVQVGRFV